MRALILGTLLLLPLFALPAPAAAQAGDLVRQAVEPNVQRDPETWKGQVAFSLISVTGNAEAVTSKVGAVLAGDWAGWATELRAAAAYGQAETEDGADTTITALNGQLNLRGDRKLGERTALYLLTGVGADHVASIEVQYFAEPGFGVVWIEDQEGDLVRFRLRTDLGFRFTREERFQYYPVRQQLEDLTIYSPRLAAEARYALSENAAVTEILEVLPDVVETDNLRVTSTTVLGAQLTQALAVQLAFSLRYIGMPAPGKQSTDTELAAGLSLAF